MDDDTILDIMALARSIASGVALALIRAKGDPEAALAIMSKDPLESYEDPENAAVVKGVAEQAVREAAARMKGANE